jgi:2,5-diketo-D-gluconate reductase B
MTQQSATGGPRANGMPRLGLGTWENTDAQQCAESVRTALEMGYRHIDTAQAYGNEESVGEGIAAADVDREDVFLATKVWIDQLSYDDVIHSTTQSLNDLGVDSVDLLYVHWPAGEYDPEDTLRAFEQLYDDELIDRIGVSNFQPEQVERAIDVLGVPLFANQVECHPLLPQRDLRDHAEDHDYELVAYSPLLRGGAPEVDVLADIADDHGVSAHAVSLAWLRQTGVTAIPKATSEAHIRDNWSSLDLQLSAGEIDRIDAIDERRREVDPDFGPWN